MRKDIKKKKGKWTQSPSENESTCCICFVLLTCPWYSPASCTVCSILPSNSYLLLVYLFHSFVSVSTGILKTSFITDTILAAKKSKRMQLHLVSIFYYRRKEMHLCLEIFKAPNFLLHHALKLFLDTGNSVF